MNKRIPKPTRVFYLSDRKGEPYGMAILPENTDQAVVSAAWSYAMQYSAKGLDLPDYEAAVALMLQRHPSWQFVTGMPGNAAYNPTLSSQDKTDV